MAQEIKGSKKLLAGIKVLDFTQYLAGPSATRILADLGANVIKIERTPSGDLGRKIHLVDHGQSAFFIAACAGKKSVCVEIKHPKGKEIVYELVRQADVVVENYSPGVMARLGLNYDTLKELNPKLIMCSVSGYGQDGPYAKHTSFDIIAQAQSGVMSMTGQPDGPPTYVGNYFGDPNAGIHGALAICAALFSRAMTGEGQYIDVSQLESLVYLDYINFPLYMMSHGEIVPQRFGGDFFNVCPYGVYKAKKGYVVLAVVEHQWPALTKAMGMPDLINKPEYQDNAARLDNREALNDDLQGWLSQRCLNETMDQLVPSGGVVGPVYDAQRIMDDPHYQAREDIIDIDDPELGKTKMLGVVPKFSETPGSVQHAGPTVGEHNQHIYNSWLGLEEEDLSELSEQGTI